jgi:hypothetical protein
MSLAHVIRIHKYDIAQFYLLIFMREFRVSLSEVSGLSVAATLLFVT